MTPSGLKSASMSPRTGVKLIYFSLKTDTNKSKTKAEYRYTLKPPIAGVIHNKLIKSINIDPNLRFKLLEKNVGDYKYTYRI